MNWMVEKGHSTTLWPRKIQKISLNRADQKDHSLDFKNSSSGSISPPVAQNNSYAMPSPILNTLKEFKQSIPPLLLKTLSNIFNGVCSVVCTWLVYSPTQTELCINDLIMKQICIFLSWRSEQRPSFKIIIIDSFNSWVISPSHLACLDHKQQTALEILISWYL